MDQPGLAHSVARLVLQLGVILIVAKLGAEVAERLGDPRALFIGGIVATTSVAVSARVLGDLGQLDTPEGVTILGGAVVDDVLGILELGLAVSVAAGLGITLQGAALEGGRALAVLLALTVCTLLVARQLTLLPVRLRSEGAAVGLAPGSAVVA